MRNRKVRQILPMVVILSGLLMAGTSGEKQVRVLFLGDSLTAGLGVEPGQAFPALVQEKADSLGLKTRMVNAGLSGETSSGGLRRVDWLLQQPIDMLVLELGGNDALRGIDLSLTRKNLQGIIEKTRAKYPDVKIVIAGMQAPPNLGQDYTSEFKKMFIDLAKANKASLIPFLLNGVGGIPELNQADQIHPNPAGHIIIAETVWNILRPIVLAMQSANKR